MSAHFPLMPISHSIEARLLIGLPIHRLQALTVLQKVLLSNGACSNAPKIGRIHVVKVAETIGHV